MHFDYSFVILYFTFWSHLFPLPCGVGSTVPGEGFDSGVIMPFFLVCCGCDTSYIVSVHVHCQASIYIYTFVVCREFMACAASQAGVADSSRAPGLTSGLQGSVNVHRGALMLVTQWQCISSFVFHNFWREEQNWKVSRDDRDNLAMTIYL